MKKYMLSFLVSCLSLAASFMTFQAAAQENLTEAQVRTIVNGAVEHAVDSPAKVNPASSLYGPRFEVVQIPESPFRFFKFDKETGDTWVIDTSGKTTSGKKLWRPMGWKDEARPGEINYQLLVVSWQRLVLLNVHTGTMWESRLSGGRNATFEDFKEVDMGL